MTVHKIAAGDTAGYVAYLASQGPERRRGDYYLGLRIGWPGDPGSGSARGPPLSASQARWTGT
ncbi:MAG: hypothetical protein ACYDCB_12060, partial [Candidatus Dormibacteria bacterium]